MCCVPWHRGRGHSPKGAYDRVSLGRTEVTEKLRFPYDAILPGLVTRVTLTPAAVALAH